MARPILVIFLAAVLAVFPPNLPQAQVSSCGTREAVKAALDENHSETLRQTALTAEGNTLEVYTTDSGSTWTIVLVSPHGVACLVGAGQGWSSVSPIGVRA